MNRINVREEFMPPVIDAVERKRVLAALSKEEHMAALREKDLLAALQKNEPLLKLIPEVGRG